MKNKICCIFNLAPHYRAPIYTLMDKELQCDFYFGDKVDLPIKQMDYKRLNGYKSILKNTKIGSTDYRWQKGAVKLLFKPYKNYIITGDPNVLSNWAILILSKFLGKNILAWTHGIKEGRSLKRTLFVKTFYKFCSKVLLYGNLSRQVMLDKGFREDKLITIYNSLDYESQLLIRNQIKKSSIYKDYFKNSLPIIIYIGRIQKSKKLDLLVKAIQGINSETKICNLVFIGKDIGDNDVKKLVNQYNINDSVWFYGPCYEEKEIGNLIYNADVCVSPGPVGLTALHAMTFGTPVITNDNFPFQMPEFEVISDGQNGTFFKNDNLQDLINSIKKWTNLEKEEREKIRLSCYKTIDEKWNPNYQIEILKSIIN